MNNAFQFSKIVFAPGQIGNDFDTSNCTDFGYTFAGCSKLLYFPH